MKETFLPRGTNPRNTVSVKPSLAHVDLLVNLVIAAAAASGVEGDEAKLRALDRQELMTFHERWETDPNAYPEASSP